MDVFITIILVIILIVWLLGRSLPRILVWALNRKVKKMSGYTQGEEEYSEGNVIVEQRREEKIVDDTIGEYVDFEETKD